MVVALLMALLLPPRPPLLWQREQQPLLQQEQQQPQQQWRPRHNNINVCHGCRWRLEQNMFKPVRTRISFNKNNF